MVREPGSSDQVRHAKSIYLPDAIHLGNSNQASRENKVRSLGSIYTPRDLAQFLTSWAIHHATDKIIDVGIGEGAFIFTAYERLLQLGAKEADAQQQLFGAEVDIIAYNKFIKEAQNINVKFSNLQNTNFFNLNFPLVDAIVGNPPYIRRKYIENVDKIRESVFKQNLPLNELNMSRMTDMYIYFLLHSLPVLKPGGRLAVITADSWMNVSYGEEFKKYLWQHFKIEKLITMDRRVFNDAQVKPVLILATKKETADLDWSVQFVRIKNGLSIGNLQASLHTMGCENPDIACTEIKSSELKAFAPWGIHFKAPQVYEEIESHRLMTHMMNVAETRIGLQTLAKEFFVLTPERVKSGQIEEEFLVPLAQSIRYITEPMIDSSTEPPFYLFYCAKGEDDLQGTKALDHIAWGENTTVEVRGKNRQLVGYHNKERIKRSHRKLWYDLKSPLERRGRAHILIPRLVYRTFMVVWNKADFVPGELFIEFLPRVGIDIEVYLAILTSSISEFMLRTHAQVYGGGTFNINPGRIKNVPIVNVTLLTQQQKEDLKQAYMQYLLDDVHNREAIDGIIYRILGLDSATREKISEIIADLVLLATSSKKKASACP